MPYDDGLAHRIRQQLDAEPGPAVEKLFGGLGFLLEGHTACGVVEDSLFAWVGPDADEDALENPHARPADGGVFVDPSGGSEDERLAAWPDRCLSFVDTLPSK